VWFLPEGWQDWVLARDDAEMMEFLKIAALFFFYLALLMVAALGILGLYEIVLRVHAALQRRKHVRR
jgi:hypothetical protein